MDRNVCVSLVILALVLACPDTKAAAVYNVDQAVMPKSSSSSMRLEDVVAPELAVVTTMDLDVRSRVYGAGDISNGALDANKPRCVRNCPAPAGYPYTGRGCNKYYDCRD
ncbi:uncharacterized protein LOC119273491 [Triticum dicoccoides]|uniref:uncharacterized protein LOC119273491 n=1 Tax=Triticum dicoccoides TaxID=85692 RepID=UPI000E79C3F8|nr:uncharacterized protein LOC119273491 [Triticum dicoccoides]